MKSHAFLLPGSEYFSKPFNEICLFFDGVLIEGTLCLIFFKLVFDAWGVMNMGEEVFEFNNSGLFTL